MCTRSARRLACDSCERSTTRRWEPPRRCSARGAVAVVPARARGLAQLPGGPRLVRGTQDRNRSAAERLRRTPLTAHCQTEKASLISEGSTLLLRSLRSCGPDEVLKVRAEPRWGGWALRSRPRHRARRAPRRPRTRMIPDSPGCDPLIFDLVRLSYFFVDL